MECELCGRKAVKKGKMDGAIVSVCSNCASFCEKIMEIKEEPKKIIRKEVVPDLQIGFFHSHGL